MDLGDGIACEALTKGLYVIRSTELGLMRLAIPLPEGGVQHFERPMDGGPECWRATTFEDRASGFTFDEPVTAEWGIALDSLANSGR
ncbi:hypothetical protein DEJ48_36905 [Streptomyces venezuelae]|uniref:Uncharacterized protein n=1 Tax=Streptomyces venezuelae TaxID=54571 RepID=A0A5P2C666_STRVZ|nr:hypothetical protein [Streptomyces venezuelae]QES38265.1 hypothetical protein DEJ48_36905 [Streptomyces venezuelae]